MNYLLCNYARNFNQRHGYCGHLFESRYTSKEDELLSKDEILNAFTENREEQYRMFVEGALSHEEQELLIQKDMGEDERWLPW